MTNVILEKLAAEYPGSNVQTRDLAKNPFPHFGETHFGAVYTPEAARSAEQKEALKHSDEAIKEVFDADILVIAVPMYNLTIPSTLKSWIDHLTRVGVTFKYVENGLEGLIKGKKVYLAISSGNVYSQEPRKNFDFTENYMRAILGFLGMTDVTVFRAEGTSIPGLKETAIAKATEKIQELV